MDDKQPFHIGLCLAGAVSAGAYTAGVMDYLLEAFDEWERRKREDPDNTPRHQVRIPVIGGASAGGMTGLIASAAMHGPLPPVRWQADSPTMARHPENRLYHSWVDLLEDDMFPWLLDPKDIHDHRTRSLLNSGFIDEIAARTLHVTQPWTSRPYITDRLRVFTTLTNLEGLRFKIRFNPASGSASDYHISVHNDYACFELNIDEAGYGGDGWMPLDLFKGLNTGIAMDAAMATGAFPLGLRARTLSRPLHAVKDLAWLRDVVNVSAPQQDPYVTLNVDGGMINNEPFERVREVLNELGRKAQGAAWSDAAQDDYDRTSSTVIMVDPFPSTLEEFDGGELFRDVLSSTLGAMLGQLRTKPAALADALHSDKAGQYVIGPRRSIPLGYTHPNGADALNGAEAIACGALGGFSGFLHKEFRVHDYYLGRANCEKFLRDQFTVRLKPDGSIGNPILRAGYNGIPLKEFLSRQDAAPGGVQIIPVYTKEHNTMPLPVFASSHNWPVRPEADIDRFRSRIKSRADALITDQVSTNWWQGGLLWVGRKLLLNGKVADAALNAIKGSLTKHGLMQ